MSGCECKAAGFCPVLKRQMTRAAQRRCKHDPKMRELFDAVPKVGPIVNEAPPANLRRLLPCIHRGDVVDYRECETCGGKGKPVEVYACAVHGRCTHSKVKITLSPEFPICLYCPEREPEPIDEGEAVSVSLSALDQPKIVEAIPDRVIGSGATPGQRGEGKRAFRRWRRERKGDWGGVEIPPADDAIVDRFGRSAGLRGAYLGSSLFLIVGGPSLNSLDLSRLTARGVLTMAVNNAAAVVRPNLWIHGDPVRKFHHGIWRDPGIQKFTPEPMLWHPIREKVGDKFVDLREPAKLCPNVFGYRRSRRFNPETFLSENRISFGNGRKHGDDQYPRVLSTFLSAIKLSHYLGAVRVFLLGCDWRWEYGEKPYAFDESRPVGAYNGNNESFRKLSILFGLLAPRFADAGFEVYNCNPDSRLEAFPFLSFDAAIEAATRRVPQSLDTRGWYA